MHSKKPLCSPPRLTAFVFFSLFFFSLFLFQCRFSNGSNVALTGDGPLSSFQRRSPNASLFQTDPTQSSGSNVKIVGLLSDVVDHISRQSLISCSLGVCQCKLREARTERSGGLSVRIDIDPAQLQLHGSLAFLVRRSIWPVDIVQSAVTLANHCELRASSVQETGGDTIH